MRYILEFYNAENKIDVSYMIRWKTCCYNRFIKKRVSETTVHEFIFYQHKASLSKKISEYLGKKIVMNAI